MSADEQQIRDVIQRWLKASARGDLDAVLTLMTEDVVFLSPSAEPLRGQEAFASLCREVSAIPKVEGAVNVQEIRVAENLATCWSQISLDILPAGETHELHRMGHCLSVFLKGDDGQWRLHRDANMIPLVFAPFGSMSGT